MFYFGPRPGPPAGIPDSHELSFPVAARPARRLPPEIVPMSTAAATVNPVDASKPWFACRQAGLEHFDTATQRFRFVRELDVSPEHLFAIFEDEVSWTVWCPGIDGVDWTSPRPFGVGTTRTVHLKGGLDVYERFIAWESGRRMAFVLDGASQEVWWTFGELYQVEALGGGRSRLAWTVAYEPRGVFAKIHFLVKPFMRLALGWFMDRLQRYCREQARHG